jgi:hypothetical protein
MLCSNQHYEVDNNHQADDTTHCFPLTETTNVCSAQVNEYVDPPYLRPSFLAFGDQPASEPSFCIIRKPN